MSAVEKLPDPSPEDESGSEPLEGDDNPHVLVLGDEVFTCADKLPIRTLVRYADGGLEQIHHILVKLVHEDDTERMWDAFEGMPDDDAAMEAINKLIETYSERPTERPSPSRSGSKTTRRT
jgi:hypothetical protein